MLRAIKGQINNINKAFYDDGIEKNLFFLLKMYPAE